MLASEAMCSHILSERLMVLTPEMNELALSMLAIVQGDLCVARPKMARLETKLTRAFSLPSDWPRTT